MIGRPIESGDRRQTVRLRGHDRVEGSNERCRQRNWEPHPRLWKSYNRSQQMVERGWGATRGWLSRRPNSGRSWLAEAGATG